MTSLGASHSCRSIRALVRRALAAALAVGGWAGCNAPPPCSPACAADYACNGTKCVLDAGIGPSTCATPTIQASATVAGPLTQPTGCITPIGTSAFPSGQVQAFGPHRIGDVLSFTVPSPTASFSIVSQLVGDAGATIGYQGQTLSNTVVPLIVNGPSGQLYDDAANPPTDLSTAPIVYLTDSPVTGVMTVPNTSAMLSLSGSGLPAGNWSFTVGDFAAECLTLAGCTGGSSADVYDVTVVTKPGAPAANGTVDVAFYFVDTGGFTASSAVTNPRFVRMVQTLGRIYAQSGICLGAVTFYDVQPWAQSAYGTHIDADRTGPCDNLNQMFTLSVPGTNALNFFLVQQIASSGNLGGQVAGIDGTIPGPSSFGGTVHSGAAVNSADLQFGAATCQSNIDLVNCGPDITAFIAAHEGGHWMGLYHTTEAQGTEFDSLSDTPTCECKSCVSNATQCADATTPPAMPVFVNASNCGAGTVVCGGGENLMFWLLDPKQSLGLLSVQQGQVMRANPVIY